MEIPRQAATSTTLQWSGRTDRGKVRHNNEDAFIGLQFDAREVHHLGAIGESSIAHLDFAFAVSDGMGGALAGEHASRIAVDKIMKLLPRSYRQSAVGLEAGFADVLEELFAQIHGALAYLGRSYEECSGMETTLSLCWFTPGRMYFGHIGDSRIYYLPAQAEPIRQLSMMILMSAGCCAMGRSMRGRRAATRGATCSKRRLGGATNSSLRRWAWSLMKQVTAFCSARMG